MDIFVREHQVRGVKMEKRDIPVKMVTRDIKVTPVTLEPMESKSASSN